MDTEYTQEHPNAMVSQKYSCSGANCLFYHIEISSDNSKATVRQLAGFKTFEMVPQTMQGISFSITSFQ